MSKRSAAMLFMLAVCLAGPLTSQQLAEVTYSHYDKCKNVVPREEGCVVSENRRLSPGGTLRVRITRTRADRFTVEVHGYAVPPAGGQSPGTAALADLPHDELLLELTHSARYGGYVVTITPKDALPPNDSTTKMPGPAVIVIAVESDERNYVFSGGISLTTVRSDVYVAEPPSTTTTTPTYTVAKADDRRDAASVGFGTFVNVRVPCRGWVWTWFWPSIGIGLETDGSPQTYFGVGVPIGRSVFLNGGVVLGRVDALPPGLTVDSTISDPNALTDLPQRSRFGLYLGMSFTFLGGGQQAFGRPFAGAGSP